MVKIPTKERHLSIHTKPESFARVLGDIRVGSKRWMREALSDVQCVQNQDMVVVLCKSNHVAFACNLESTASWNLKFSDSDSDPLDCDLVSYLDVRTLEFPQEAPIIGEHHHVELVAVRVSNKDITSIYNQVVNTRQSILCSVSLAKYER